MRAAGPFEVWLSPRWNDGWKPRGFWLPSVKILNRYGPPPHGLHLHWMRGHFVWWFSSDRKKATEPK